MNYSLFLFFHLLFLTFSRKINVERYIKGHEFSNFLTSEFNYSYFLKKADYSAERYVPFLDSSNDTYFKVGILLSSQLLNYTKISMEDQLGSLKNKPWIPVNEIKQEFAKCALFKYGTFSEQDFKYDKGMYGWMNIMKFSCSYVNDKYLMFAMAFSRTRFRLKQVVLKQQSTHWATSGRSLITRDVQKITEVFTIRFALFVKGKLHEELKKRGDIEKVNHQEHYLQLTNETFEELAVAYGRMKKHVKLSESRSYTFSTIGFGIKSRIMITLPHTASQAIQAISNELSDDPLKALDLCHKATCTYDKFRNATYNPRTESHFYSKENALIHTVQPRYSLISYQYSKPYFAFDTLKRKTASKIIDVKQTLDGKAEKLWSSLLDQQFALAVHVHNQEFFPFEQLS